MNLNLFLAKKIKGTGLSSVSDGIACVSVAISICVILISIAILSGFKTEIGRRAAGFSGEILMTLPGEDHLNDVFPLDADLSYLPAVRELDGVRSVSEVAYKPGMVKTEEEVHGLMFKGVDSLYPMSFYQDHLTQGSLPDFSGRRISDDILISERLAGMLGYEVGDRMTVYFVGDQVRLRRFRISGLFNIQLEDMDEKLALVDIRQTRRLNGWKGHESSCIEIALGGDGTAASVRQRHRIFDQIGEIVMDRDAEEDDSVVVREVDEVYPAIFDWLSLLDLNVLVVLVLMMAVAGFNMISGLLIILFEKISMIGLLKSLGMRTVNICKVFILRGGVLVLKGMAYGTAVAVVLLALQKYLHVIRLDPANYFVDAVPVDLTFAELLLTDLAAFALMMLILILPSMFISRISPDRTIKVN